MSTERPEPYLTKPTSRRSTPVLLGSLVLLLWLGTTPPPPWTQILWLVGAGAFIVQAIDGIRTDLATWGLLEPHRDVQPISFWCITIGSAALGGWMLIAALFLSAVR